MSLVNIKKEIHKYEMMYKEANNQAKKAMRILKQKNTLKVAKEFNEFLKTRKKITIPSKPILKIKFKKIESALSKEKGKQITSLKKRVKDLKKNFKVS